MKRVLIAAVAACTLVALAPENLNARPETRAYDVSTPWVKSKTAVWVGQYNTKYKIDKKGKVSVSKDGKTWKPAKDGIWLDHLGKWMKIDQKKVKWSDNEGKTWSETPDWKWQGGDGRWYKFDKQFSLWAS
jgi:hypothetical protein